MNRIKQLREEKQITQQVLGDLLGLETSAISKLEKGRVPLKDEYIIKLANFFKVSSDYLLGNSDVRNPNNTNDIVWKTYQSAELDEKDKELVLGILRTMIENKKKKK